MKKKKRRLKKMNYDKPLSTEHQTNSIREVYRLKGESFDTMLIETRGIEDLEMRLYIAFLKEAKQPLFLDKTATAKLLYTYNEEIDTGVKTESKDIEIWVLMKEGEKNFIRHDKIIDKRELESLQKEENKNE